ncbi:MAG: site-specific DNA-methyltransferase, partial [Aristaeellaceae bacterium]
GHRRFILVEMGDYAESITAERVRRVISGYGEGRKAVPGTGGGFSFYELGEPLLINGLLNSNVSEDKIRAYVYYTETRSPLPAPSGEEKHLLGVHEGHAYYFYYEADRLTTLNREFLRTIQTPAEGYLIYADVNALSAGEMERFHITFKKIPRDIARL